MRNKRETFLICTADLQILKNHVSTYTNCRLSNTTPNSPPYSLVAAAARSSPFWSSSSSADNMSDPKKASERAFREEVLIWNKIQTTHTHKQEKIKKRCWNTCTRARTNNQEREASSRERESSRREISYTQ